MIRTPGLRATSSGTWPASSSNSPSSPGAVRPSVASWATTPLGVTRSTSSWPDATWPVRALACACAISGRLLGQLGGLLQHVLDRPDHLERLLGDVVVLAGEDLLERPDRVVLRHVGALEAGERGRHRERL